MNLKELALKHDVDKNSNGHNYVKIYEQYFNKRKNENLNILEIGVAGGKSMKLWEEYFPNSNIYGIDIDKNCKQFETERIKIVICDQKDIDKIKNLNINFDIIIDDGSHLIEDIVFSFENLINFVNPNSIYIIEDLHDCLRRGKEYDLLIFLRDRILDINFNTKFFGNGNNTSNSDLAIQELKENLNIFESKIKSINVYTGLIIFQMR